MGNLAGLSFLTCVNAVGDLVGSTFVFKKCGNSIVGMITSKDATRLSLPEISYRLRPIGDKSSANTREVKDFLGVREIFLKTNYNSPVGRCVVRFLNFTAA